MRKRASTKAVNIVWASFGSWMFHRSLRALVGLFRLHHKADPRMEHGTPLLVYPGISDGLGMEFRPISRVPMPQLHTAVSCTGVEGSRQICDRRGTGAHYLRMSNWSLARLSLALARIHRMTALGTALEEARGCSSESGIMVLEQKPARKQGAPNRCCHRTTPDRIRILFDDHRLVAKFRPAPAGHPRPAPGPARTRRPSP